MQSFSEISVFSSWHFRSCFQHSILLKMSAEMDSLPEFKKQGFGFRMGKWGEKIPWTNLDLREIFSFTTYHWGMVSTRTGEIKSTGDPGNGWALGRQKIRTQPWEGDGCAYAESGVYGREWSSRCNWSRTLGWKKMKLSLVDCFNMAAQRGWNCLEAGMYDVRKRRVLLKMGSNCHQVTTSQVPLTHVLSGLGLLYGLDL